MTGPWIAEFLAAFGTALAEPHRISPDLAERRSIPSFAPAPPNAASVTSDLPEARPSRHRKRHSRTGLLRIERPLQESHVEARTCARFGRRASTHGELRGELRVDGDGARAQSYARRRGGLRGVRRADRFVRGRGSVSGRTMPRGRGALQKVPRTYGPELPSDPGSRRAIAGRRADIQLALRRAGREGWRRR